MTRVLGPTSAVGLAAQSSSLTDTLVAWGTLALAVATLALVVATWRAASAARTQLTLSAEVDAKTAQRRRAENSAAAIRRYVTTSTAFDELILPILREDSERRLQLHDSDAALAGTPFVRTSKKAYIDGDVDDLDSPTGRKVTDALRHTLDAVEELAVGVRLGVYDAYVVYNGVRTNIVGLYDVSRTHIYKARQTRELRHEPSPTAYEHYSWLVESCFPAIERMKNRVQLADATQLPPETPEWQLEPWTDPRVTRQAQDPDRP